MECRFADKKSNTDLDEKRPYPFPHDGPRSAAMEDGCWEVKWGHRDDAVSALMVRYLITFSQLLIYLYLFQLFFMLVPLDADTSSCSSSHSDLGTSANSRTIPPIATNSPFLAIRQSSVPSSRRATVFSKAGSCRFKHKASR